MFQAVLSTLSGICAAVALLVHTLFLGCFLYLFILLRWILPFPAALRRLDPAITEVAALWVGGILWWTKYVHGTRWDIKGRTELEPQGWYLVTANHQSWADIFVLFKMFHRKIPLLKFFIKKEMARIPVVGQAWWALDFPFMQRYSKAYLAKHPEKAGQDLEATRRACERFSREPTSVMNFLEGTRFTPEKQRQQQSPYRHLLQPKAGGIAYTIRVLGDRFAALTNVTIVYPKGAPSFWDMMCGRMRKVIVRIEERPIPPHFAHGDYQNNPAFRREVQEWVSGMWERKDALIEELLSSGPSGQAK